MSDDVLKRTVRGENTGNLDEWLKNASPEGIIQLRQTLVEWYVDL